MYITFKSIEQMNFLAKKYLIDLAHVQAFHYSVQRGTRNQTIHPALNNTKFAKS